jgi:hypothetical protein
MAWKYQTLSLPGNSSIYIETKNELISIQGSERDVEESGRGLVLGNSSTWCLVGANKNTSNMQQQYRDRDVNPDLGNTNQ